MGRGCPCVFPVRWRFVFDECCEYSRNAVLAHDPSVELLACNRFLLRLSAHCEAMTGGCTGGGIKSFFRRSFQRAVVSKRTPCVPTVPKAPYCGLLKVDVCSTEKNTAEEGTLPLCGGRSKQIRAAAHGAARLGPNLLVQVLDITCMLDIFPRLAK